MIRAMPKRLTPRSLASLGTRNPKTIAFWAFMAVALVAAVGMYWAVSVSATPKVSPPAVGFTLPEDPRLLILGDSYTLGSNADPRTEGYAYLVANALGWPSEVDGMGGTGFTWGGGTEGDRGDDYTSRINRRAEAGGFIPNVLLLQGGQNDYRANPAGVFDQVTRTIRAAQAAWPGVQIIVMGPSQPMPGGALLQRVSSPIGRSAAAAQVSFISPLDSKWFTEQNSPEFSADAGGTHLNNAGHVYMAERVLEALNKIGVPTS